MQLTHNQIANFQEKVWQHYEESAREMPWRKDPSPYKVLVSELMLQQTQVTRVIPKFDTFMYTCPDIAQLADKSLSEVLTLWSGLGYNRRAKFLHQTAQIVVRDLNGELPKTVAELMMLPGIGKNTAGAICAYAYNQPVIYVETNIRTVLFHEFFDTQTETVSDRELESLVGQVLDREHPREWYWALMDYGAYLKKTAGGRLTSSRHYVKQAPLKGSIREVRGQIVKQLVDRSLTIQQLSTRIDADDRFEPALTSLLSDGLVEQHGKKVSLTGGHHRS